MTVFRLASLAAVFWAAAHAASATAACYVVYDMGGQVVYRAQTPPVDMARNLHETLPALAPGGKLVFTLDTEGCEFELNRLPLKVAAAAAAPAKAAPRARKRAATP